MPSSKNRKKKLVAILAGVAVAAAVSASASTLGGAYAHGLGADVATTSSVLTQGVVVTWDTEYQAGGYVVKNVTLQAKGTNETIPAGADVKLTVTGNTAGDPAAAAGKLTELTKKTSAAAKSVTLPVTGTVPAHDVVGVAVVIDGNNVAAAPQS